MGRLVASPPRALHGVPRRDVRGRVHVSVAGEVAGHAPERRLALAGLWCDVPARTAPLHVYASGTFSTCPAALSSSRRTSRPQPEPRIPRFSPAFAATFRPGSFGGAPGRPGHRPDVQVLDPDHVEPARQIGAGLLGPVFSPVGLAGLQPGNRQLDPAAPPRSAPGPRQPALEPPERRSGTGRRSASPRGRAH